MNNALTPSQILSLGYVNERPGKCWVHAIGLAQALELEAAGYITIKNEKCWPTAKAAAYPGRSAAQRRSDRAHARATLIGRWGALHF